MRSVDTSFGPDEDENPIPKRVGWQPSSVTVTDVMTSETGRHVGRWAQLRPLLVEDYQALYEHESGTRWRLRGATVSPRDYEGLLWQGILSQFAVCSRSDRTLLGLVGAYRADLANGHCYVMALRCRYDVAASVKVIEGLALLISHLFEGWPFRKVYFETDEDLAQQFHSLFDRVDFPLEGRLRGHVFLDGRYLDQLTFALYRSSWEANVSAWLPDTTQLQGIEGR